MTLTYKLDLDILKLNMNTENEISVSRLSKVRALQTDAQRDTTRTLPCTPHTRGW